MRDNHDLAVYMYTFVRHVPEGILGRSLLA
jgi:hypothetical protein